APYSILDLPPATWVDVTLADVAGFFPAGFRFDDLAPDLPAWVTFGDVVDALLNAGDYPYEDIPPDDLDLQSASADGGTLPYSVHFVAQGGAATASTLVRVRLPQGFRYVPGSASLAPAVGATLPEPVVSGRTVAFRINGTVPGTAYTLALDTR